jgi:predicted lipid-binding transport protein (Tim44 family)
MAKGAIDYREGLVPCAALRNLGGWIDPMAGGASDRIMWRAFEHIGRHGRQGLSIGLGLICRVARRAGFFVELLRADLRAQRKGEQPQGTREDAYRTLPREKAMEDPAQPADSGVGTIRAMRSFLRGLEHQACIKVRTHASCKGKADFLRQV